MWYPFKNYREGRALRRAFMQKYEGKFELYQTASTAEADGPRKTYYFHVPWAEYDIDFAQMCLEILGEILKPFQVTAHADTWKVIGETPDQDLQAYGWLPCEHTPAYHHKILTAQTEQNEGLRSAEGLLIALAQQLDRPLATVMDSKPQGGPFNHVCLYCNRTAPASHGSPDGLPWAMDRRSCDLWVEFNALPAMLYVEIDVPPPDADANAFVKIIQRVCSAYGKELIIEGDECPEE